MSEGRRRLPAASWAIGAATLMIAHQVAGKATRDALFLSQFDVTALPKMVMASAVLSMLAVILIARLLAQFGPTRVMPSAFALSALLFCASWGLYAVSPGIVSIVLYLQMGMFGAVLISGFWSVVNERFDPYTAKQTIARIGAAATLGGLLGGVLAGRVADAVDIRAMLLVLAFLHALCGIGVRAIGEGRRPAGVVADLGLLPGLQLLRQQRYLQWMGALMVLGAVLAALLDYAMKAQASLRYTESEDLVGFFGQFYAFVGVATFLVQWLLAPRLLKRFGIGPVLALMPGLTVFAGLLGAGVGRLWATTAIRAVQMVTVNSLFRSAFELLYTPLPPLTKRPTKAIIDVASDRFGDVVGSGILLALLAMVPTLSSAAVVIVAVVVALLALLASLRLHRGYVDQLATSLRDGAISLAAEEVIDATTRHTLAELTAASERELLAAKIRQMKQQRAGGEGLPERSAHDAGIALDPATPQLAAAVAALGSGDEQIIRRCLAGSFMDVRLAPCLIPLLAHDTLAGDVRMELRWMAPRLIGTLGDALLDPDLPLAARQRIPSVLEVTHNPRAVEALMNGLEDEEFNVRYSSARALARMHARDAGIAIDAERVIKAVERELGVDERAWTSRALQYEVELHGDARELADVDDPRMNVSMAHVFTLLGLVLDRQALRLALRAVASRDRTLRGTALEYLENVLPENLRHGLWPWLGEAVERATRSNRPSKALVEDLRRGVKA
ncbi:MAG TPA: Npt1/Npt2 family nucleotide transporter [Gammaproteobacteria bacterium]|nr:Npt1/Npt2 family nucleotide transporter [Gammaproteobacteria bacterium]